MKPIGAEKAEIKTPEKKETEKRGGGSNKLKHKKGDKG
jgi:hypothetical protein